MLRRSFASTWRISLERDRRPPSQQQLPASTPLAQEPLLLPTPLSRPQTRRRHLQLAPRPRPRRARRARRARRPAPAQRCLTASKHSWTRSKLTCSAPCVSTTARRRMQLLLLLPSPKAVQPPARTRLPIRLPTRRRPGRRAQQPTQARRPRATYDPQSLAASTASREALTGWSTTDLCVCSSSCRA